MNILDHVTVTVEPDSAVQNGQRHSLRAHDPFEAGSLSLLSLFNIEADDDLFAFVDSGFAGTNEE